MQTIMHSAEYGMGITHNFTSNKGGVDECPSLCRILECQATSPTLCVFPLPYKNTYKMSFKAFNDHESGGRNR